MNKTINISLPNTLLDEIKALVQAGEFASISDAIRHATRAAFSRKHSIPTYRMSERALKSAQEARRLHKEGKLQSFNSVTELLE